MRILIAALLLFLLSYGSFGQSVDQVKKELIDLRDMFSNTFVDEDGTKNVILSNGPINYSENGKWLPINNDLIIDAEGENYINIANSIRSFFPILTSGNDIKIEVENNKIFIGAQKEIVSYSPASGVNSVKSILFNSESIVEQNSISYKSATNDIIDKYIIENGKMKNDFILNSIPENLNSISAEMYGFREEFTLPLGWRIVNAENEFENYTSSSLLIVDNNGRRILTIPAPVFYDKFDVSSDGSHLIVGKFLIEEENGKCLLSTLVPLEWLKSPSRIYPVTIDPTVIYNGNSGGWQSQNNYVDNSGFVFIGVCCGNLEHRAWIKFGTAPIPDNSCVTDVQLEIFVNGVGAATPELVHAYDITGQFGPYGAIIPAVYADMGNGYYTSFTIAGTGTYGYYDLGPSADALLQSQLPGDWFEVALIFDNEPSTNWKRLTATSCKLSITYDAPPCAPLPVDLVNFKAECNNQFTQLSWSTITETQNDYFEIEKSMDMVHFTKIGTIEGAGTSQSQLDYHFTDMDRNSEISYYRMTQHDINGVETMYDMVASNCLASTFDLSLDNEKNVILISSSEELVGAYQIYNAIGQIVQTGEVAAKIPFTKVSGVYFVHIISGDTLHKVEILKN